MFAAFQSVCMATRLDVETAAAEARRLGFVEPEGAVVDADGLSGARIFMLGSPSAPTRLLILARQPAGFGVPSVDAVVCSVSGKRDAVAVDDARGWIAGVPATENSGGSLYVFRNMVSGRTAFPANDDDQVKAAALAGELVAFMIQDEPGQTSFAVTRALAPKSTP
ncbi:MAG: hypothetical protein K9G59_10045 [Caulobacter sp.]|nr:hypothetical protein [Caulobacter sp.]